MKAKSSYRNGTLWMALVLVLALRSVIFPVAAVAQGPIDISSATWLTDFIAAQRLSGSTSMIAQAPNATLAQHAQWMDETRHWAEVCGGDPNCGVSVWTGYMGGWSVAAFRYLPLTFWGVSLGTWAYQRQYAPYGYYANGSIRY